jgi:hypothetical protein
MDEDLIQSSDCFRTIQTVSMDATGNRAQYRMHDFFPLRLPRVESIHHRGDFMNGSKSIGWCRVLASMAMLSGAMFTILLLPAYGQQDVSPDWYDPAPNVAVVHPAQPAAAVHSSQLPAAAHGYQQTAMPVSTASGAGKLGAKHAQIQSGHNPSQKSGGAQSGELVAIASREPR